MADGRLCPECLGERGHGDIVSGWTWCRFCNGTGRIGMRSTRTVEHLDVCVLLAKLITMLVQNKARLDSFQARFEDRNTLTLDFETISRVGVTELDEGDHVRALEDVYQVMSELLISRQTVDDPLALRHAESMMIMWSHQLELLGGRIKG